MTVGLGAASGVAAAGLTAAALHRLAEISEDAAQPVEPLARMFLAGLERLLALIGDPVAGEAQTDLDHVRRDTGGDGLTERRALISLDLLQTRLDRLDGVEFLQRVDFLGHRAVVDLRAAVEEDEGDVAGAGGLLGSATLAAAALATRRTVATTSRCTGTGCHRIFSLC